MKPVTTNVLLPVTSHKEPAEPLLNQARGEVRTGARTLAIVAVAASVAVFATGCRQNNAPLQQTATVDPNAAANDPAMANMAGTQVAGASYGQQPYAAGENYPAQQQGYPQQQGYGYPQQAPQRGYPQQQGAPIYRQAPNTYDNGYGNPNGGYQGNGYPQQGDYSNGAYANGYDPNYDPNQDGPDPYAEVDTSVPYAQEPPPALPDYDQPEAPAPDDIWTPGYWDYANQGYYYVPGAWVQPPFVGALWTPGWWGYRRGRYCWHRGYWGRHVGYYGGVDYGNGYTGYGYQGGYWGGDHFFYNQRCNHVRPHMVDNYVYSHAVVVPSAAFVNNTRISYAGGPGGIRRMPVSQELNAGRERHVAPLPAQWQNRQQAAAMPQQFFRTNHGHPAVIAVSHPLPATPVPPNQVPPQRPAENPIFAGRTGQPQRPAQPIAPAPGRETFAHAPGVPPQGRPQMNAPTPNVARGPQYPQRTGEPQATWQQRGAAPPQPGNQPGQNPVFAGRPAQQEAARQSAVPLPPQLHPGAVRPQTVVQHPVQPQPGRPPIHMQPQAQQPRPPQQFYGQAVQRNQQQAPPQQQSARPQTTRQQPPMPQIFQGDPVPPRQAEAPRPAPTMHPEPGPRPVSEPGIRPTPEPGVRPGPMERPVQRPAEHPVEPGFHPAPLPPPARMPAPQPLPQPRPQAAPMPHPAPLPQTHLPNAALPHR